MNRTVPDPDPAWREHWMTDAEYTEILGPKCPSCGWRGGQHRPAAGEWLTACPEGA